MARLPNTTNIAFPGLDGQVLLVALDMAGVACSAGSACASGSSELSPTLRAMRLIQRPGGQFPSSESRRGHDRGGDRRGGPADRPRLPGTEGLGAGDQGLGKDEG